MLATGFDALVNRRANPMPWPRGSSRYALAAMAELRVFSPLQYRLTLDGQVRELEAMLVAVGNTSSVRRRDADLPGRRPVSTACST